MTGQQAEIARLEQRKQELEERLAAIQRDLGQGLDADSEERAVQLENLDVLQEIARLARAELREIENRLQKGP